MKQKQVSLTNWTTKAKSPPPSTRNANNAHGPISNSLCSATNNSDSITTTNNSVAATHSISVSSVGTISINTSSLQLMSCEGIFKWFRMDKLKKAFSCYNLKCRANINSSYKFCFVGGYITVFSKECNGKDGIQRQRTKGIKGKDAIYFSCRHCFELMSTSSRRIKTTIMNRTDGITQVEEIIQKHDIAPSDFKSMKDFSNTNDTHLSPIGLHLKQTVKLQMQYYQNMEKSVMVKNRVTGSCGFIPGVDNFLKQFIKLYLSQDDTFKNSLLVCLMRSYVAKANGVNNPQYAAKVMNFFVAIAASGNKRSFEFVSGNLCAISLRHTHRVVVTKRSMPFINRLRVSNKDKIWTHSRWRVLK